MNEKEYLKLKLKVAELKAKREGLKRQNLIYFFEPLSSTWRDKPYQQRVLDLLHEGKRIVAFISPNKVGKTGEGACIVGSWCLGFEPWNRLEDGSYNPSSLGIAPPVNIRITGSDWEHHIGKTIIPELKKWIPSNLYTTRKNNQGVEFDWRFANGSTLEILSYNSDLDQFESWLGHGWWADEPCPKAIHARMSRGLFMTGGKMLYTLTPLSEPWLFDLINSGRPDIGVVDKACLWDNPILYEHDKKVLLEAGLTEDEIKKFMRMSMRYAWGDMHGEPPGISDMA